METHRLLRITMSNRFLFFSIITFLLLGCNNNEVLEGQASIEGTIQTIGGASFPNGIKIRLQKVDDTAIEYIAVTDLNGKFQFSNIEYGTYDIDFEKEGMEWMWMEVDGQAYSYYWEGEEHLINLFDSQTKHVKILLRGGYVNNSLVILDVHGSLLNEIVVPKGAGTVSFQVYNGSQHSHYWSLSYNLCSVIGYNPFAVENVFSSFNNTEGNLAPGENVTLVGVVNPAIFGENMGTIVQGTIDLYDYGNMGGDYITEIGVRIEH